jgi:hypothetical protein
MDQSAQGLIELESTIKAFALKRYKLENINSLQVSPQNTGFNLDDAFIDINNTIDATKVKIEREG